MERAGNVCYKGKVVSKTLVSIDNHIKIQGLDTHTHGNNHGLREKNITLDTLHVTYT